MRPALSRIGDIVSDTSMSVPSRRLRTVSNGSTRSPLRIRARIFGSSSKRSGGMTIVIGFPTASATV